MKGGAGAASGAVLVFAAFLGQVADMGALAIQVPEPVLLQSGQSRDELAREAQVELGEQVMGELRRRYGL